MHDFDEVYFVLDGELIFQVEDTLTTKRAGELSFAPRNVPHTLANHGDAPARYVLVCTPAGSVQAYRLDPLVEHIRAKAQSGANNASSRPSTSSRLRRL